MAKPNNRLTRERRGSAEAIFTLTISTDGGLTRGTVAVFTFRIFYNIGLIHNHYSRIENATAHYSISCPHSTTTVFVNVIPFLFSPPTRGK